MRDRDCGVTECLFCRTTNLPGALNVARQPVQKIEVFEE
jgi:hypothetical protein